MTAAREALATTDPERDALLDLLRVLDADGYDFVTPTPNTHARVVRSGASAAPSPTCSAGACPSIPPRCPARSSML